MRFFSRLRDLFQRQKLDAEMADEMRHHLEEQTERNTQAGMSPTDAQFAAQRQFGNIASIQQRAREGRAGVWLEILDRDVRFALRRLTRTPAFAITALFTLAVCIGANTSIFAVIDALLLRPLPFPEPERLVTVINSYPKNGVLHGSPSMANYFERRGTITAFEHVAVFQPLSAIVGQPGNVRRIGVARVTPDFFATLGVSLATGKMFTDAELSYQTAAVVVLTDEFWRTEFGRDPDVVGKTLINDGLPSTIIGVLPAGFRFLSSDVQFFKPLASNPPERALANRHSSVNGAIMIGRLAKGATLAEAQAQLDAQDARLAEIDPKKAFLGEWGYRSLVRALHGDIVRGVRPILLLLQAAVLVLLLIGAANLTNLLLVRISARTRELAVRQALGAREGQLAREASIEIMALAVGGGIIGLGVGAGGIKLLSALGANQLPLGTTIVLDARVAGFMLAAALVLGGFLSVAPIWLIRRLSLYSCLQAEGVAGLPGATSQRLRQLFGILQIALGFVLLCGAGLLGLSLKRALSQPVGFAPEHVLVSSITLPWKGYRSVREQTLFVSRLEQAMRALPGGIQFAVSSGLPFTGVGMAPVTVERSQAGTPTGRAHDQTGVTAGYWHTMGIPLVRGRLPEQPDSAPDAPRPCVVDQAMADTYWPGRDPIGQRLSFGATFNPADALTVVGVVGNVKHTQLTETEPMGMVYVQYAQFPTAWMRVVLRSNLPSGVMNETFRKVVKEIDPELFVAALRPMDELIDDSLLMRRSPAMLAGIFAAIALLLCAVGTYGVLAYAVSYRRREIGVRLALGARPQQIVRLFLDMGGRILVSGCVVGAFGVWASGTAMRSMLFEVAPFSPSVVGGAALVLSGIVGLACWLSARRAAKVDPVVALRAE